MFDLQCIMIIFTLLPQIMFSSQITHYKDTPITVLWKNYEKNVK